MCRFQPLDQWQAAPPPEIDFSNPNYTCPDGGGLVEGVSPPTCDNTQTTTMTTVYSCTAAGHGLSGATCSYWAF